MWTLFLVVGVLCGVLSIQGAGVTNEHIKRRVRDDNALQRHSQNDKCDFNSLEVRLQRLEAHLDEKFHALNNMMRQPSDLNRAMDQIRRDISMTRDSQKRYIESEVLTQIFITNDALQNVSLALATMKKDLSGIANETRSITDQMHIHSIFNPQPAPNQATYPSAKPLHPTSCQEIKRFQEEASSSVYLVQPKDSPKPFMVYCDMEYQNGGWLIIHNRFAGEQDFFKYWQDYKIGFGNIAGEHWLGLEHVYEVTGNEIHELSIQMVDINQAKSYAHYSHFSLGSEEEGYPIKVLGGYRGDAGDSLSYHAGSKFSTKDRDQDSWEEGNCAASHAGAWWYKSCDKSNLNGKYLPGEVADAFQYQPMYWGTFGGANMGLKYARIMVRPRQEIAVSDLRF